MSSIMSLIRGAYRRVVPLWVRDSRLASRLKELLPHNLIYDADYYAAAVEEPARRSAGPISDAVISDLDPATVVDVGCGTGALLAEFRSKGCKVFGLEYSEAALAYCRNRQLDVRKFNLEQDNLEETGTFDVAVSMEVAEHLPEPVADRYVDLLARLSRVVVFTAAPPGQGGTDHVNEQPPSYWIAKFRQRGYELDEVLGQRWQSRWKAQGVESWYYSNLMIFRRNPGAAGGPGFGG